GLIKAGGSLTNDGTYVYALRGSNTNDSYKYIPSSNQWSSMEATTIAVGVDSSDNYAKGGITFSSSTPGLFATSGSGTSIMKNSLTQ
ncbi:MAG TPA: hypothetical protein PK367_01110, partial [Candidatus Paceibacterota bacterium]|nr:hypothetical protein [Candidatus Paceibacterota bacterium]